ncbi:hypothetical protein ACR2YX_27320, partial [Klebsiella pneumoniae]
MSRTQTARLIANSNNLRQTPTLKLIQVNALLKSVNFSIQYAQISSIHHRYEYEQVTIYGMVFGSR